MTITATSVSRRRSLFIWGLCCALAGLTFVIYASVGRGVGQGQTIMPLDDTYIHFQYARQIAAFQPYVYNPGLPPTSGATSFLYPYVLALGDWLGFDGLNLGLWAMAVGALALALSAWLVDRIALSLGVQSGLAAAFAGLFALNGLLAWHFMSGMETGLTVLFTLLTLYGVAVRHARWTIAGAALLALTRPEGAVLAVGAVIVLVIEAQAGEQKNSRLFPPRLLTNVFARRAGLLLALPVFAIGVQPLVNRLVTGSAVASGNAAKSLFGIIPADMGVIIGRIAENFICMWREFLEPGNLVVPPLGVVALGLLALIGLVALARKRPLLVVFIIGWMLAGTLAVSTLDTAFWHFKRYQMPFVAAMLPLAAVAVNELLRLIPQRAAAVMGVITLAVGLLSTAGGAWDYLNRYAVNVGYVYAQPYQMARWLDANTPPDAVIAVHDVGMMRYMGGRTTLDMVGLTTPGAADYWRNGPGSTGEFLERMRPNYIASYGHGHGLGLGYLADTDLYADPQVEYTVALDSAINVALAAETQGIYIPDWTNADRAAEPLVIPSITRYLNGLERIAVLDVADIDSENTHDYRWSSRHPLGGFPTEYNQFGAIGCACTVMDGVRRINGEESFTIPAEVGRDVVLVTRLHPASAGEFDVYANDSLIATRVIPALPGGWLEVPTLIPAAQVIDNTRIRIVPRGDYLPAAHWVYQGAYTPTGNEGEPFAAFQEGAIEVHDPGIRWEEEDRTYEISWFWRTDGRARGDYKIFLHVLDENDNIAAQADTRPGGGALPPGNWLPGVFRDTITIDASNLAPGRYRVMMGLYHPDTFERLAVTGGDEQNRLYLGEIGSDG